MSRTAAQVAAGQRRTLQAMREKLLGMSQDWDGLDQYLMHLLEEAADKLEEVRVGLLPEDAAPGGQGNG